MSVVMSDEKPAPYLLSLPKRFVTDAAVSFTAAFALSWFITPLDSAVVRASAGRSTIMHSVRDDLKLILTRPHWYLKAPQFRIIFGTYGLTYLAKNWCNTMTHAFHDTPEQVALKVFWVVFFVNGGLCVFWRDPGLAKILAGGPSSKRVPMMSYSWWIVRDLLTTAGTVVLPDYLASKLEWDKKTWTAAQMTFPLLIQFITSPCHLMGLDYFNVASDRTTFMQRVKRTMPLLPATVGIRIVRMFFPWSVGLVINTELRGYLQADLNDAEP